MMEGLEERLLMSTYYVATNGSDAAAGTGAAPFATLGHAMQVVKAGDTVLIKGGTYDGTKTGWTKLAPKKSGTASAPITIAAVAGQKVVIDGKTPGAPRTFMTFSSGESYLNVKGLTLKNFLVDFNFQGGSANAHNITLDALELSSAGVVGKNTEGRGVRMADGVHDINITNTKIHDIGGVGIAGIGNVSNVKIDHVTINNVNDGRGVGGDGDGINFTYRTPSGYARNITVSNTKVSNTSEDGIDIKGDNIIETNNAVWNVKADAYKAWSPYVVGHQGRFTITKCVGSGAGQIVFEAFGLPNLTITGSTFVGNSPEQTVSYKRGTGSEKWKGALSIRSTVMEHLGARQALTANKYNMSLFALEGNTYYSKGLPNDAVTVYTTAAAQQTFSNAAMANGSFTTATGAEHSGTGTYRNVTTVLNTTKVA
jgi:hypothetical protein